MTEPLVAADVHTHLGERDKHVGPPLSDHEIAAWGRASWDVDPMDHEVAVRDAAWSVVLAFDAEPVGVVVPNELVAETVRDVPNMVGFASVNPARPDAIERLDHARYELDLRGLKLGPTYQHVHPHDPRQIALVARAAELSMPILWHQGTTFTSAANGDYARPLQLDRLAREFPSVPMIIAHFGHPWAEEAVSVIRRHEHMYVDCSALDSRPWQFAQALAAAYEYRVFDRILFGSDYPFSTVQGTIDGLRKAAGICRDLGMAPIGEDDIDAILQRDPKPLLWPGDE